MKNLIHANSQKPLKEILNSLPKLEGPAVEIVTAENIRQEYYLAQYMCCETRAQKRNLRKKVISKLNTGWWIFHRNNLQEELDSSAS